MLILLVNYLILKLDNRLNRTMLIIRSILDTIEFLILFFYYCLEAFILMFFCLQKNVAGKIVLVTGSANGVGREVSINLARLGSILILWDIDEEGNCETAELAKANGALAVYTYKCDLRKREEIYAVAEQVKREVGDVDILINNAGVLKGKIFLDLLDSDMEETLEVNTTAHFWTCKAFLPAMIARNKGHLVSIASVSSLVASNKLTDYTASKAAAFGFLESLAFEMRAAGKKGIKTTIVCPYYVDTELVTGVQTTRPFLFPILDVGYVGKKIVDGILKEKLYVVLPPYARFILLKIFLPAKVVFLLVEYLGLLNNLDHFRGEVQRGQVTKDSTGLPLED
ncbi:epidermal retinol dehydrogenase 2 [Anolis carolinensis]|uniref:Short chain dehydrogenase/reductase family 16C member 5 n=1 Tax=Anolis carolinensis TaxID=28377 RepID=A0A803T4C9_ANOCA|nr:PREDICTED: epidermal retinol dehydrogenase 2 [Anolis carolinensis]|eukprot:XP_003228533.2 PREDICTED: epidermal retinol dehydrogenase 2 [Anolis carolinensis]